MEKIKNLEHLLNLRKTLSEMDSADTGGGKSHGKVRIRVHMGTSGLASGAREIYDFLTVELEKRNIDATVIRTGDMGYCFAEPTVEVTLPGEEPVVFGNVDRLKADRIIEKYIKAGELLEGVLPVNYQSIEIKGGQNG